MSDSDEDSNTKFLGGLFTLTFAIYLIYMILGWFRGNPEDSDSSGPSTSYFKTFCKWVFILAFCNAILIIISELLHGIPEHLQRILFVPIFALIVVMCYYVYTVLKKRKAAKEEAEVYQHLVENFFPGVDEQDALIILKEYVFDYQKRIIVLNELIRLDFVKDFIDGSDALKVRAIDIYLNQETICYFDALTPVQKKSKHWNSIHPGVPMPGYFDTLKSKKEKILTSDQYEKRQKYLRDRQVSYDADYAAKAELIAKSGKESKNKFKRGNF